MVSLCHIGVKYDDKQFAIHLYREFVKQNYVRKKNRSLNSYKKDNL